MKESTFEKILIASIAGILISLPLVFLTASKYKEAESSIKEDRINFMNHCVTVRSVKDCVLMWDGN